MSTFIGSYDKEYTKHLFAIINMNQNWVLIHFYTINISNNQ